MITKSFISTLVVLVLLVSVTGCGGKGPPVQFVEGTVSVDGSLLENCTVTFIPQGTSGALLASGVTDAKGYFRISSVEGGAIGGGTTVGEYFVSIVKKTNSRPPIQVDEHGRPIGNPSGFRPMWDYVTPMVFELQGKRTEVPITVTVKKGKNRFGFDLKADGSFTVNGQ